MIRSEETNADSLYSLAFFRFTFGLLMSVSLIRFLLKGWVGDFYLEPGYLFTYYGFGWAAPPQSPCLYCIYGALLMLAVLIMLGALYRPAIVLFFLLFSYTELWDKTVYLNHYYLISLLSFLMVFLPMNAVAALDCLGRKEGPVLPKMPVSPLLLLKIQVGSVYFFGGIAKIGYDWLFLGQPLKIWFSANSHLPLIGPLLVWPFLPFIVAWLAMAFDLSAPFLLYFRKTRAWIYPVVLVFHALTSLLFPIGMFPLFMCAFTLIFFPSGWHRRVMTFLFPDRRFHRQPAFSGTVPVLSRTLLAAFFLVQLLMPFRAWLYPGDPLWHEQGFRFSWRIMLMEKNGALEYRVKIKETGKEFNVKPSRFLTQRQVQQMSFQPDMILQFAHFLHDYYLQSGLGDTEIRAVCYVSLNGRGSRLLIDPEVDLAAQKQGWRNRSWITDSIR